MCADTVITDFADTTNGWPAELKTHSSFGELHVASAKSVIAEAALKIINLGPLAIGMAGHFTTCRTIAQHASNYLKDGKSPRESFSLALKLHLEEPRRKSVQIAAICIESGLPVLFVFNEFNNDVIEEMENECVAHLGSASPEFKAMTFQVLNMIRNHCGDKPMYNLTLAIAFLQSCGQRNYLLERQYFGGTFCGLSAYDGHIYWQPDIVYWPGSHSFKNLPMNVQGLISVVVRDNVLVVQSTITSDTRYFGDSLSNGLSVTWNAKWWDRLGNFLFTGNFDYLVALDTQRATVTACELAKHAISKYAYFWAEPSNDDPSKYFITLSVSPEVWQALRRQLEERNGTMPVLFNMFPYATPEPPLAEQILAAAALHRRQQTEGDPA